RHLPRTERRGGCERHQQRTAQYGRRVESGPQRIFRSDFGWRVGRYFQKPVSSLIPYQSTNPATVLLQLQTTFNNADAQFKSAISKINGTANDINSVLGKIDGTY